MSRTDELIEQLFPNEASCGSSRSCRAKVVASLLRCINQRDNQRVGLHGSNEEIRLPNLLAYGRFGHAFN